MTITEGNRKYFHQPRNLLQDIICQGKPYVYKYVSWSNYVHIPGIQLSASLSSLVNAKATYAVAKILKNE